MTGIGAVVAAGGGVVAAPPLTAAVDFSGGSGVYNVAGASGNLIDNFSPPSAFSYTPSGGTPPYVSEVKQLLGDASGKLSLGAGGTPATHDTILWSGFSLNETEGCYVTYTVTDSAGAHATARYPSTGSIIIKRTS